MSIASYEWSVIEMLHDELENRILFSRGIEPMGAKTWMIAYANQDAKAALSCSPVLDRAATDRLARSLFSQTRLIPIEDGTLADTCPRDGEVCIGCFPGVSIVAAEEFGIDHPSTLPQPFIDAGGSGTVTLHAMHSVVDWFAFAQWQNGKLIRSLSLSPDSGILEDIGPKFPFEQPYWAGEHPAVDPEEDDEYPFPFFIHSNLAKQHSMLSSAIRLKGH